MSEIIGQGKDREPRRWRWWQLAAIAAGLAGLLAGLLVVHHPGRRHVMARHASASSGTSPAVPGSGGRQPNGPRMPPRRPARMVGRPLPRDAGLRLALGGRRPAWLRVTTGRAEPVRGLARRANGYQLIRIIGGWAALPFPGDYASCANCAPKPMPVYYIADGSRVARRLGTADFVAPAATRGAVWLVRYRADAVMSATAGTAQEFSVSGAALGPRRRLPPGYVIDQGTAAGLLLVPENASREALRYQLWEPSTGRVSRRFKNVIAVAPEEIAWIPDCRAHCRVHLLDLAGGPGRVIPLAGRSQSYVGAFSPDGSLLALQVASRIGSSRHASVTRLVVAVVASGKLMAVPGTRVGTGIGVDFGWLAGSDQLVADAGLQHAWQVAVWRPGDARLHIAVTRVPAGSWPVVGPGPY